jgi:DNA-binding NarL/FixJ family response regulator
MGTPELEGPLVLATDDGAETRLGLKAVADDDISQEQTKLPSGIERLAQEYDLTEEQFRTIGSIAAGFLQREEAASQNEASEEPEARIYPGGRNRYFDGKMRADDVLREHYKLTNREIEVMECISGESSTEETADALHLSVETVRSHIRVILGKTGTHRRKELVKEVQEIADILNSIEVDVESPVTLLSTVELLALRKKSDEVVPLPLTATEIMILSLKSVGFSTKAVADQLGIEEPVLELSLNLIMNRTGISSNKGAADYLAKHANSQPWLRREIK